MNLVILSFIKLGFEDRLYNAPIYYQLHETFYPLVGDITYTNWGVTNDMFEPIDDTSKKCAKICVDENNAECDGQWRVKDCSSTLNYVCQIPCKD